MELLSSFLLARRLRRQHLFSVRRRPFSSPPRRFYLLFLPVQRHRLLVFRRRHQRLMFHFSSLPLPLRSSFSSPRLLPAFWRPHRWALQMRHLRLAFRTRREFRLRSISQLRGRRSFGNRQPSIRTLPSCGDGKLVPLTVHLESGFCLGRKRIEPKSLVGWHRSLRQSR